MVGGPLAAGEFDFGEFGHGGRIGEFVEFEIGIWHGMRYELESGGAIDAINGGERP